MKKCTTRHHNLPSTSSSTGCVALNQQCGGLNYKGLTTCCSSVTPAECKKESEIFSRCVPKGPAYYDSGSNGPAVLPSGPSKSTPGTNDVTVPAPVTNSSPSQGQSAPSGPASSSPSGSSSAPQPPSAPNASADDDSESQAPQASGPSGSSSQPAPGNPSSGAPSSPSTGSSNASSPPSTPNTTADDSDGYEYNAPPSGPSSQSGSGTSSPSSGSPSLPAPAPNQPSTGKPGSSVPATPADGPSPPGSVPNLPSTGKPGSSPPSAPANGEPGYEADDDDASAGMSKSNNTVVGQPGNKPSPEPPVVAPSPDSDPSDSDNTTSPKPDSPANKPTAPAQPDAPSSSNSTTTSPPPSSGTSNQTTAVGNYPAGTKDGITTRYWDCCKPSCSWPGKALVTSPVKTCDATGATPLDPDTPNVCQQGGKSHTCNNYMPWAVSDTLSYGFVAAGLTGVPEAKGCCSCYKLDFQKDDKGVSHVGKSMIVQAINIGYDLKSTENHFDIQMPGGGVGNFDGCAPQWGSKYRWGGVQGGIWSLAECANLPPALKAGCEWRFGWFRNASNPAVKWIDVPCPDVLVARSGCRRL